MHFTTAKVFHLAQTNINTENVKDYLRSIGAPEWTTDAATGAEMLVEVAGRRCYNAFGTHLNPNLTRVRTGNAPYIGNILKSGHGSVLEHAYDTFAFEGVSRVFTHEVIRHRHLVPGEELSPSQESLRFVRPVTLAAYFPEVYDAHLPADVADKIRGIFERTVTHLGEVAQDLTDLCGLDNPDMPFSLKKLFQASNRRVMPEGLCTGIILTGNARTWRQTIELRTAPSAEEEMRGVFLQVARILKKTYPALYQDMQIVDSPDGEYVVLAHGKV
jgi:thymidylate synthase (FAD)